MLAANVLCIKKKKKKRTYCIPNLSDTLPVKDDKNKRRISSNMLHITEDTPADMLSGAMDLTIHLPSGKTAKVCVERSTPMMDLLVQITTNHQLQITNYTLQPLQTVPNASYSEKVLTYYPNTPIGALDTQQIRVVQKPRTLPIPKNIPPGHQPFESTFRLKVHLPRNQLYVTRVSRHVHIEDIMKKVCDEKNLDPNKLEVRHPGNLDEILDPKLTLNDYMITEIYLILKNSNNLSHGFSTNDIMTLRKEEERKQVHNKTGGGVFNLIFRRGKLNTGSAPVAITENSMNSTPSENNKPTVSPEAPPQNSRPNKTETQTEKPKAPQRKRRPAPKPPQPVANLPQNEQVEMRISSAVSDNSNTSDVAVEKDTSLTICHSRHSSDSSGYHETSILSDHCNTSFPRRSRLEEVDGTGKTLGRRPESTENLTKMTSQSRSTSSLTIAGRKKKAAPPPPIPLQNSTSSATNLKKPSPVVASQTPTNSSSPRTESVPLMDLQPAQDKLNLNKVVETSQEHLNKDKSGEVEDSRIIDKSAPVTSSYPNTKDNEITINEISRYPNYEKSQQDSGNSSDISEKSKLDDFLGNDDIPDDIYRKIEDETEDWQLPSPPKEFKDSALINEEEKEIIARASVIVPELLEKLKCIEERQIQHIEEVNILSDNASTISEDRQILSKLSLENLEKRKSLVYNRELATSLKLSYNSDTPHESNMLPKRFQSELNLSKSLNQFENTLEDIRNNNKQEEERRRKIEAATAQSTLPNFKITTYDEPKEKIKVFEDDTIRSNSDRTGRSATLGRIESFQKSIDNVSTRQNKSEDVFKRPRDIEHRMFRPKSNHFGRPVNRSGSFSTDKNKWTPSKPVTRSKSQVAIKQDEVPSNSYLQLGSLSKSSSLFDVSGLQSLEVMKKIQDKLNTPTTSMETLTMTETKRKEEDNFPNERDIPGSPPRKFQYSGPPSINLGTWSERPKLPVSVKEDADYKLGRGTNKMNSNNVNNNETLKSNGSIEIKNKSANNMYSSPNKTDNQNVTIKVNGSEPISTQENGNVLIKIGESSTRFKGFNPDTLYRPPLYSLNKNAPRPHSVAFASDFDISRVPVVRSVELKKVFNGTSNNTSVTHLNHGNYSSNGLSEKSKYCSSDNLTSNNKDNTSKPISRASSFLQPSIVVRGFKNFKNTSSFDHGNSEKNNRHSWQPSNSSMTLPPNMSMLSTTKEKIYTTNQNVPFSKFNLRRTESTKVTEDEPNEDYREVKHAVDNALSSNLRYKREKPKDNIIHVEKSALVGNFQKTYSDIVIPPPPPEIPKNVQKKTLDRRFVPVLDPRDELLKSIRDFGGKKGLRSRKA